jgi:hypothetical protein
MSDHAEDAPIDPDEYARLLGSLERFAQEVPHLEPAELVRRTQAFESDLEAFVPMHTEVVSLLRRVAERAAAGLDDLPDLPDDDVDTEGA